MSTLQDNLDAIKLDKETNLLPENLRAGITALGVTGTYEGGGSGDVKLFASVEAMNADPNKSEGDMAIVYFNLEAPVTEESEFSSCIFPNIVVLPQASTSWYMASFRGVDSSFSGNVMLSSNSFSFNSYNGTPININYTSSDGVTYTRTDGGEELVDFGTTMKYDSAGSWAGWDNNIGYFMRIDNTSFEGLYTCIDSSGTLEYQLAPTQLDVTSDYVFDKTFYGKNGVETGTMQNNTNLNKDELFIRCDIYDKIYNLDVNLSSINNDCSNLFINKSYASVPNFNTINAVNMSGMFYNCQNLISVPNFNTSNVIDMSSAFMYCTNLTSVPNFDTSNATTMVVMFSQCYNLTSVPELNTSNVTGMFGMFANCSSLSNASYANITNMLPLASNITNNTLLNIGLKAYNFTNEQRNVLFDKGYIDAEIITGNFSNEYIIEYS